VTRPAAIGVVLVLAGLLGLAAWWRVSPRPLPDACADGGTWSIGPDNVARCAPGAAVPPGQAMTLKQKFDCNAATADELALVAGLGASAARAIVDARPDGGYHAWDELDAVPGVGPARLNALREVCELRVVDGGVW